MLRKQRQDCLHRGECQRKEEVDDHQSCHRPMPRYLPPPREHDSSPVIGERHWRRNLRRCPHMMCLWEQAQHEQGIGKRYAHGNPEW